MQLDQRHVHWVELVPMAVAMAYARSFERDDLDQLMGQIGHSVESFRPRTLGWLDAGGGLPCFDSRLSLCASFDSSFGEDVAAVRHPVGVAALA